MRFRILGSLEAFDGADWVAIRATRLRSLLAVLLVRSTYVVSVDQLVVELWGDHSPKSAVTQIHKCVMQLRRILGDPDGHLLRTVAPGYQLAADTADVDALLFGAQVERGHEALRTEQPERAATLLRQALALWRGSVLADVEPTPLVSAEADRLGELRLAALEARIDADLACGRHTTLIGELRAHIAENPLRERYWGQLMLALHRSGRQAESLHAFQQLRRTLIDEIGTEPCAELRRLHQELLSSEAAGEVDPVPEQPLPVCQLPADVGDVIGREEQLNCLLTQLFGRTPDGPPPVVVVFGGPGIGKSTLAIHAAHRIAAEFADGQLYLDLAGTAAHPREPVTMLGDLLHALGVTGAGIPDGTHARATLFRSLLTGRRMLLVLDDAAHSEQVRSLLPPNGGCAVVITSRRLLTDLAGARHLEIGVLTEQEACRMLAGVIGPDRIAREPEQAAAILRACAYLPLAIRIVAGKLVGRPSWPLRFLQERLDDESRRLNELRLGDLGVRASFEASIDHITDDAVRGFRLLGLLGPVTVPGWVLGPLLARQEADDVLDALVDANLLQLVEIGIDGQPRYRLHDLLRAYAVEGVEAIPEPERRGAVRRLLGTWLELVDRAVERLGPSLFRRSRGGAPRCALPRNIVDKLIAKPENWFETERRALLGAVQLAVDWRMDDAAWELAACAVPYYDLRCHYEDWRHTHTLALDACQAAGNLRGEAVLRCGLAQINIYRDEYPAATANVRRSLELFQRTGDKRGEGQAIGAFAILDRVLGRPEQALDRLWQALNIVTAEGDRPLETQLTNGLGMVLMALGRLAEARDAFERALALSRELGDEHREAVVLREAGLLYDAVGDTDRTFAALARARQIFESINDERCLAYVQLRAGRVYAAHDDRTNAATALHHATVIFARNGNRLAEAECQQLLGELSARYDDLPRAHRQLRRALHLWQSIGDIVHTAETEAALSRLGIPGP